MWLILEKFLRTSEETRGYSKKNLRDYYSERFGTNQYGQTPELSLDLGELGQYYGTQLTAKFDPSSIDLLGIKNRLEEMPYCPFIFL